MSEELRESQASKWTQLVNPDAWADRAAALEAEVAELEEAHDRAFDVGFEAGYASAEEWYKPNAEAADKTAMMFQRQAYAAQEAHQAAEAKLARLRARIAEAVDWALCTDDDHLRRILAPEGGDL